MTRPLVVLTGQGTSRADNFDLGNRLRAEPGVMEHFFKLVTPRTALDDVFSAARETYGDGGATCLARITRWMCVPARQPDTHKQQHREVFRALRDAAVDRVVLHLTTNVDGIATMVAVQEFAAVWRPLQRNGQEIPIEDIRRDVRDVFEAGRGLLHLPVHGEAGLAAVKGPPEWEGAKRLVQADLRDIDAYSTLAQGIGDQVRRIGTLMAVSGLGYELLSTLLLGEGAEVDGVLVPPSPPADIVAIGYGAGGTPERADYPFERRIDQARKRGCPAGEAKWRALVFAADPPDVARTARWYADRGFEVLRYGDGGLGTVARAAIPRR